MRDSLGRLPESRSVPRGPLLGYRLGRVCLGLVCLGRVYLGGWAVPAANGQADCVAEQFNDGGERDADGGPSIVESLLGRPAK